MDSDTLTMPQLAKRLGISDAKAYEMAQANDFPFPVIRIGGRVLVSRHAYDAWLAQFNYKEGDNSDHHSQEI